MTKKVFEVTYNCLNCGSYFKEQYEAGTSVDCVVYVNVYKEKKN